jgi:hypothetical protein
LAWYIAASAWLSSAATDEDGPATHHPGANAYPLLPVGESHRLGKGSHYVRNDQVQLGIVRNVLAKDDELVASHSRHRVRGAHRLPEPRRHRPQQLVAHVVARTVVQRLEMVEVEEHDADTFSFTPAPFQGVAHPVFQEGPVGQAGQVVVHRLVSKRPLGSLVLGDVTDHLGNRGDLPHAVAQRREADRDLDARAVLADPDRLDPGEDFASPYPLQKLRRLGAAVRRYEDVQVRADGLLLAPAEEILGSNVPDLDHASRPGGQDRLVAFLRDRG